MSFLDIALEHASLGLYVFPVRRDKGTLTGHGFKDATIDPEQIRAWWQEMPKANPGFAPGVSDVAVLDIDHGLTDLESFVAWRDRNGLPATYTVRSGSRPEFKVHMYFKGAIPDVGAWELDGCSGQVKSLGGYVLAAGSEALHGANHDKPGAPYEAIDGVLGVFADTPDVVRQLRKPVAVTSNNAKVQKTAWNLPVHAGENRTSFLMEQLGAIRNLGFGKDAILARMIELNEDPEIIADPVDHERLEATAANCAKLPIREPDPIAVLGSAKPEEKPTPVADWRTRYMSQDAYQNVKPPEFLIDGFLVKNSIAMLAGPVAQRKSIIALNVAYALCTGTPLFDYFNVTGGHERVVYLCPEMGAASFVKRIKQIGLGDYVGKTLFIQTMNEKPTALDDLDGELPGAVVIVDTITRFIDGKEDASDDMRRFAQKVFRLANAGASVVLLHHSKKGSSGTLDDGLRGSSELAAFVDSCWVTGLEDPKEPYQSLSKMRNVKQRDFECEPFNLKPTPDSYFLSMEGDPAPEAVLKGRTNDAALDALKTLLAARPKMGVNKLRSELKALGYSKGNDWVTSERKKLAGVPIPASPSP